jgi:hypothetical protein
LLRSINKTKRSQIGQYVHGNKAKKLVAGGATAAAQRRLLQAKAAERERVRALTRTASAKETDEHIAAPLLALFTLPQQQEVEVGYDLSDESEGEDDYYFD